MKWFLPNELWPKFVDLARGPVSRVLFAKIWRLIIQRFKDNFLVWLINRKAPTNAPINSPGLRHRSMTESLELQVQETWEDGRSRYSSDDLFRVFLEVLFCLNLKGRMLRHLHIDRWTVASWRLLSIRSWNKPEQVRTSKLELPS